MVSAVFHAHAQRRDAGGRRRPAAAQPRRAPRRRRHAAARTPARSVRLARPAGLTVLPPLVGMALLVGIWALLTMKGGNFPTPAATFEAAVKLFADPFYQQRPERPGHRLEHPVLAAARGAGLRPGGAGRHSAGFHDRPLRGAQPHGLAADQPAASRCRRWPGCRSGCWCSRRPTRRPSGPSSSARSGRWSSTPRSACSACPRTT